MSLSSHPSNSVKALEEIQGTESSQWPGLKLHPSFRHHWTPETVGLLLRLIDASIMFVSHLNHWQKSLMLHTVQVHCMCVENVRPNGLKLEARRTESGGGVDGLESEPSYRQLLVYRTQLHSAQNYARLLKRFFSFSIHRMASCYTFVSLFFQRIF